MIAIVFVFNLSLFGIAGFGWTANAEDGEITEEVMPSVQTVTDEQSQDTLTDSRPADELDAADPTAASGLQESAPVPDEGSEPADQDMASVLDAIEEADENAVTSPEGLSDAAAVNEEESETAPDIEKGTVTPETDTAEGDASSDQDKAGENGEDDAEAAAESDNPEPEFESGYCTVRGGTTLYEDETLGKVTGTFTSGSAVYALSQGTSRDAHELLKVAFSLTDDEGKEPALVTGYVYASSAAVMSEEEAASLKNTFSGKNLVYAGVQIPEITTFAYAAHEDTEDEATSADNQSDHQSSQDGADEENGFELVPIDDEVDLNEPSEGADAGESEPEDRAAVKDETDQETPGSEEDNDPIVPIVMYYVGEEADGSKPIEAVTADAGTPGSSSGPYTFTVDNVQYTLDGNNITVDKYNGSAAEVTIPKTINGIRVTQIGTGAFESKTTLTKITLPPCIQKICSRAFANCTNLVQMDSTSDTAISFDIDGYDEEAPKAESIQAVQGRQVTVNVYLQGYDIAEAEVRINYDSALYELVEIKTDHTLTGGNTIRISSDGNDFDGPVATVTLKVKDSAQTGSADVDVTVVSAKDKDQKDTDCLAYSDHIKIVEASSRIPGDVNDDGEIGLIDWMLLGQSIAGWEVSINESNSDVNGDGEVTLLDWMLLGQSLAGWEVTLQ